MTNARDLKLMLLAVALFVGFVATVFAGGLNPDVLLFAPLFVLVVPLLAGRYVGEDAIRRLAVFVRRRRRAPAVIGGLQVARVAPVAVRGRLVAGVQACRPPPAAAPALT